MNLFLKIIVWGLLLLMLKDANSQSRNAESKNGHASEVSTERRTS
jgi:hypothetical protein